MLFEMDIFGVSRLFDMSKTLYYKTLRINVRETRRGNQQWAYQRTWQHWVHKTQDEDKQIKNTTQHALDTTMSKHTEIM
jgi:hypothetical protein